MKKHKRNGRLLAVLMAVAMVVGMFPSLAFGAGDSTLVCGEGAYATKQTEVKHDTKRPDSKTVNYKGTDYNVQDYATVEKWAKWVEGTDNEFEISLKATGNKITPPPIQTVNVLVLDYSSSMTYNLAGTSDVGASNANSRLAQLKAAVNSFIDQLTANDFVAVVTYNTNATLRQNFIQMDAAGKTAAKNSYNTNTVDSATNIHSGLTAAYQLMNKPLSNVVSGSSAALTTALQRDDTEYNVIFMSDGAPNCYIKTGSANVNDGSNINTAWADMDYASSNYSSSSATNSYTHGATAATAAATALKGLTPAKGSGAAYNPNSANLRVFSVGIGNSGGSGVTNQALIFNSSLLSSLATSSQCYFDTNSFSATEIFNTIAGEILSSVVSGSIVDVIPAGFAINGEITAWRWTGSAAPTQVSSPVIDLGEDADGNVTVTWSNVPNLGADMHVELRIPLIAEPTCPESAGTNHAAVYEDSNNPGHYIADTNVEAYLYFTNVTNPNSDPFSAKFAVPAVHVPQRVSLHNVYYKYWVNGVAVTGYIGASGGGLVDGDGYLLGEDVILETYDGCGFVYATEGASTAVGLADARDEAFAAGTMAGEDVYYDLYYLKHPTININLTKVVSKFDIDSALPAEYAFGFALTDEQGNTVATMSVSQNEIDRGFYTGSFTLEDGVTVSSLLNRTLSISEQVSVGNAGDWVISSGGPYVTIGQDGGVTYLRPYYGILANVYKPAPQSAIVPVGKFFTGDLETFKYWDQDGAEHACIAESHEHGADCMVLVCGLPEHTHSDADDSDCVFEYYDDELQDWVTTDACILDEHTHGEDCWETHCVFADHECGPECWAYTFSFELRDLRGNVIDDASITLTAADIIAYNESGSPYNPLVTLAIPEDALPRFGYKTFRVYETGGDYLGWNLSAPRTVLVSRLGNVQWAGNDNYVRMNNAYGEINPPEFEFGKTLLDYRSGSLYAAGAGMTFLFDLYDGESLVIGDIPVEITEDGTGVSGTITLPAWYSGETFDLTLSEQIPEEPDARTTYDERDFTVHFVDGVFAGMTCDAEDVGAFENLYLEPIAPEINIVKTTNGEDKNGTFMFEIAISPEGRDVVYITTEAGEGEYTLTLDEDYTGTVTVSEVEGWINDGDEAEAAHWDFATTGNGRTFSFNLGVLTESWYEGDEDGAVNVALFQNDRYEPGIDIGKIANRSSLTVGGTVTYTLSVNARDEALTNVVITDDKLPGYAGTLTVVLTTTGEEPRTLVEGEDYEFDRAAGAIIFKTADEETDGFVLGLDDTIIISYSLRFNNVGSVTNLATAEGSGIITGIPVEDSASVTVRVSSGDPGDDPTPTPGDDDDDDDDDTTPPPTSEEDIDETGVPLAEPEEEVIEEDVPLGDAPQTGDYAMLSCLIALLTASAIGLAVIFIDKKKKNNQGC